MISPLLRSLMFASGTFLLAGCATTGDPREGGLYGWSEEKALLRRASLEGELTEVEKEKTKQLNSKHDLIVSHHGIKKQVADLNQELFDLSQEVDEIEKEVLKLEQELKNSSPEKAKKVNVGDFIDTIRAVKAAIANAPVDADSYEALEVTRFELQLEVNDLAEELKLLADTI